MLMTVSALLKEILSLASRYLMFEAEHLAIGVSYCMDLFGVEICLWKAEYELNIKWIFELQFRVNFPLPSAEMGSPNYLR